MKGWEGYERAKTALLTDHVLTSGQLLRLGADPSKFPSITDNVRVTNNYFSERIVKFHALEERTLRRLKGTQLAHLAGVAEMRLELGVEPGVHWESTGHALNARFKPDAIWRPTPDRTVLIEFDSGDYSRETIHKKLAKFIPQGEVYWGMTSGLRISRWSNQYPNVRFLLALWWETPEERNATMTLNHRVAVRNADALARARRRQA